MKVFIRVLLISITIFSIPSWASEEKICGSYFLSQPISPSISKNEKLLVCPSATPGWSRIPKAQAQKMLGQMLRKRGYYKFRFVEDGVKILLLPGRRALVKQVKFSGEAQALGEVSYTHIVGEVLNSQALDKVKNWTMARLRANSYPCPEVGVSASYETGEVLVEVSPRQKALIGKIQRPRVEGVHPSVWTRFDAFRQGEPYNWDYVALSSRRIMAARLADYAFFENSCANPSMDSGDLNQNVSLGDVERVLFAVGASTEEYPILKARYQHSLLDQMASTALLEVYLSSIRQTFEGEVRYYPTSTLPRFYLSPQLNFERRDDASIEAEFQKYGFAMGYVHDTHHFQLNLKLGALKNIETLIEGVGIDRAEFISIETNLSLISHYFEYFSASPRQGLSLDLSLRSQQSGVGASASVNQYRLKGVYLKNLGRMEPPVLIFGIRGDLAALDATNLNEVPQSYRLVLGGQPDLRGFYRNSINNFRRGFLTTAYLGLELRLANVLPFSLQPFILSDWAQIGLQKFSLEKTVLSSQGIGVRWESQIGTFRGSLAAGQVFQPIEVLSQLKESWVAILTYGKEF